MSRTYLQRLVDPLLDELLAEFPAVLLVGPRATGKTTTALRHAKTIVQLDDPAQAAAFRADPGAALRALEEPVLVDEWQVVPEVLGAIKRTVDRTPSPGRYLITGSVRAVLDGQSWPLTGRAIRVQMSGLVEREIQGHSTATTPLDVIATGRLDDLSVPTEPPDLRDYVELALRSGFPDAVLREGERSQRRWLDGYVEELLTRDVEEQAPGRDPARLRRYLEVLALNTAGTPDRTKLSTAAGIAPDTAVAYDRLLTNLLVVDTIPAWSSRRIKRHARAAKRFVVDPGVVGAVLGLDVSGVMRDGDLLGRVIETFVAAQLRAEVPLSDQRPRLHHLRTEKGRQEIDMLIEYGGGRIVAIEVKAGSAPTMHDARHLVWLRDQIGDRFVAGLVLHTGPGMFDLAERVAALPICALWS
jgi:hypothetical protein